MSEPEGIAGRLTEGGHELFQRVYFEDTDFSGRVYHARFLHFVERGRSDYLRLLGVHHYELAAEDTAFVVRRMEIDFLRPASIDEVVRVWTEPDAVSAARIALRQEVWRGAELLFRALVTVVLVGPGGRPLRLPTRIREALGSGSTSRR